MPSRMDSMLSYGAGKMKKVRARLSGLVGVFGTLAEQHGEITALLERAKTSDEKFSELWPTIRRELISHETAELREVYPVLRQHEALRAFADQHDKEAAELEQLIESLQALDVSRADHKRVFQQLIDTVVSHAREEEREIFPRAQEVIGKPQAEALDAKFIAAKKQIAEAV